MSENPLQPPADIELCADGSGVQPAIEGAVPVADITTLLAALADPVRIAIIKRLGECEEARACGSFDLPVSKSTLSHHFKVLREAGLIVGRYEGTRKLISLRHADVDAVYPGLLDSVLRAAVASGIAESLPDESLPEVPAGR